MHHCYILCTHTLLRNAINQIYANLFTNQFLPKVKVGEGGGGCWILGRMLSWSMNFTVLVEG